MKLNKEPTLISLQEINEIDEKEKRIKRAIAISLIVILLIALVIIAGTFISNSIIDSSEKNEIGAENANAASLSDDSSTSSSNVNTNNRPEETETAPITQPDGLIGPCSVTKIVDGDTIYTSCDSTRIRFIGIDTPESTNEIECGGIEAANRTKALLTGKSVYLEADRSQGDTDKYGRPLRYVWLDGKNINYELIIEGFAEEYTYDVPYKYQTEFMNAERLAKQNNLGIWSNCNP